MRELILKMSISVDGFVADRDGGIAWVFGSDPEAKAWSAETVANAGLHIMGSRTFRGMAAHWPTATDAFAAPMNAIPKAVFSRRGDPVLEGLTATSWAEAQVMGGDLAADIDVLKRESGLPVLAHGGASFARSLLAARLVDRLALLVCPIALGRGFSIFSGLETSSPLRLLGSTAFPGGAVAQVYACR